MDKKEPLKPHVLRVLSCQEYSEMQCGVLFECRRMRRDKDTEEYEDKKKRAAIAEILAKKQRIDDND